MALVASKYIVRQLPPDSTLQVEIIFSKEYRIRQWAGLFLIRMAARVMGCRIQVNEPSI